MRKLMKRLFGVLAVMLAACMCLPAVSAEEAEEFSFELHANGQGYVVAAYHGQASSVTVPDWFDNLPVISIGDGAFQGNTAITKVALPSTITVIGAAAFKNCTSLSSMTSYTAADQPPEVEQPPEEGKRVPGDADGDGMVNIMDALAILQYDVGWEVNIHIDNADVDGSGSVDIMDALAILQYDVGWEVELQ